MLQSIHELIHILLELQCMTGPGLILYHSYRRWADGSIRYLFYEMLVLFGEVLI